MREGDPTTALRNAAVALGLDGDVTEASYSSPDYPSYVVGPEDGSAASLNLTWSGTGSWWYSDPAASPAPVCAQVPLLAEDGSTTSETYEECLQPEIPASESLAPSTDEARALAAEIFDATGFDVDASDIRITADAWQTIASASLTVDGVATASRRASRGRRSVRSAGRPVTRSRWWHAASTTPSPPSPRSTA